jgi:hypothetical protein
LKGGPADCARYGTLCRRLLTKQSDAPLAECHLLNQSGASTGADGAPGHSAASVSKTKNCEPTWFMRYQKRDAYAHLLCFRCASEVRNSTSRRTVARVQLPRSAHCTGTALNGTVLARFLHACAAFWHKRK